MKTSVIEKLQFALHGKEHVIWDWNGTLLDDVGHAVNTMNGILVDLHMPLVTREYYRKNFEFPVFNYYKKLGFDFNRHSFEELCHRFVDSFMAGFHQLPLVPEMRTVLFHLHDKQITQSVLSAADQTDLDKMIDHFDLTSIFKFVYGIDNKLAGSKIHRGHDLIQQSGFSLEKTTLVGDTLHDLEVGRALGIDVVLLSHGHQCPTRLRDHHEMVIEVD